MTTNFPKPSITLLAGFQNAGEADAARNAITALLEGAKNEVAELFERGGGTAEIDELTEIYARFGFTNDCGWEQERPLITRGEVLIWETPDGLNTEEAQILLVAHGAQAVDSSSDEDEPWRAAPHPANWGLTEDDEDEELSELSDEPQVPVTVIKKTLH